MSQIRPRTSPNRKSFFAKHIPGPLGKGQLLQQDVWEYSPCKNESESYGIVQLLISVDLGTYCTLGGGISENEYLGPC